MAPSGVPCVSTDTVPLRNAILLPRPRGTGPFYSSTARNVGRGHQLSQVGPGGAVVRVELRRVDTPPSWRHRCRCSSWRPAFGSSDGLNKRASPGQVKDGWSIGRGTVLCRTIALSELMRRWLALACLDGTARWSAAVAPATSARPCLRTKGRRGLRANPQPYGRPTGALPQGPRIGVVAGSARATRGARHGNIRKGPVHDRCV
jgi:hypothetical protein